ncbi:MAG: hypothetical protein GY711_06885 [bacterium]|nr:hypothetical protein [bacterium]
MRLLPLAPVLAIATSAAFGQLTIVSSTPGSFVDISASGTPLSLGDDGTVNIATTVGNALLAPGIVCIGSNGGVRFFGDELGLDYNNQMIPSMAAFSGEQVLLPFWDDIDTQGGNAGQILWEEIAGTFIVQWQDAQFYNNTDHATFQLQVFSSGPVHAQFVYADVLSPRADGGGGATIGYQAGTWGNDVQYSFDTSNAVTNGTVLSLEGTFSPPAPPPPAPCGQLLILDSLPGAFVDISASGIPLGLGDDAEVDIQTTVGNALFAAGTVRIGSNGGVRFGGAALELEYGNGQIPSNGAFSGEQALLPFWDDFNTGAGSAGEIYWDEVGGTLIVQWQDAQFYASTDSATFQLQVPSSGSALAHFVYTDVQQPRAAGGASATIGYQAGGIDVDVEWAFNIPGGVTDGTVLTLTDMPGVGQPYCGPSTGNSSGAPALIQACGATSVTVNDLRLTATQLPAGQIGYFLVGRAPGSFVPPNAAGPICLQGDIGRFNALPQIVAGPLGTLHVDLANLPTNAPGSQVALPGETLWFQCWYQDGSTSNFTDGVFVTLQ